MTAVHERRERPLVLVADEDEMTRLVVATACLGIDVDAVVASDCEATLALFRNLRPDAVLLDVMMGDMSGFDVCTRIRTMSSGAYVPIMVMTALDDLDSIDQAFGCGATDFVTKPLSSASLAHRIRYVLRSSRAQLDAHEAARSLSRAQRLARVVHWEFEPTTQAFRWSEASGQIFEGLEGEDDVRQAWLRWVHPGDRARVEGTLARRDAHQVEYRLVLPNGEAKIVHQEAEVTIDVVTGETRVMGTAQDITALRAAEGEVKHLADYDSLTNLPNRACSRRHLETAIAVADPRNESVAVLSLGLDLFRRVNESVGHSAGSAVLQEVAGRLRSVVADLCGPRAMVGRTGGVEFVVIIQGAGGGEEDGHGLFRALEARLSEPYVVNGREVVLSCSGGLATYPTNGGDVDTLLMHADAARHGAKELGKKGLSVFSSEIREKVERRLCVEARLRRALMTGHGLALHYQPKVQVPVERVAGVEALLRWVPDALGTVSPMELVSVAEDAGLVVLLGDWVLREACRQAKEWSALGLRTVRVAVNISAHQFAEADFAIKVARVLAELELPAEWLELEITEGVMMLDTAATSRMLAELKLLGVHIALDDFGTGYSSLAYLTCLPIDTLKIDRSFINGIGVTRKSEAIVATIIALATSLGIAIVAEGVETPAQREFLEGYAAMEIQGWLFARAMPGAEVGAWIERHEAGRVREYLATG